MTLTTDNRDKDEMLAYYEARIEALTKRVRELEDEAKSETGRLKNESSTL